MLSDVIRGLSTWHSETLSAWTMVLNAIVSSMYLTYHMSLPNMLIWLHIMVHTPFSLLHHTRFNWSDATNKVINLRKDTQMIYVSHVILHLGLCASFNVPWQVSIITTATVIAAAAIATQHISKTQEFYEVENVATKYSWIFTLHYIPIFLRGRSRVAILQFTGFICIFLIWNYVPLRHIPGFKNVNINNAFMHIGLILNNLIAHHVVTV